MSYIDKSLDDLLFYTNRTKQINDTDLIKPIPDFALYAMKNLKNLEPELSKTVDENFWGLI